MAGIFKAYDVRGIYPEQLDETMAQKIGLAFPLVLDDEDRAKGSRVVVSRDMRSHSEGLQEALIEGLRTAGLDVVNIGLATTPMNYFAVDFLEAAGGVQVTASHNPAEYNGLKFSKHGARPVSGDGGIPLIERRVASGDLPRSERRGNLETQDITQAYGRHMLSFLEIHEPIRKLRVAVDAANGMGTIYLQWLEKMGLDLELLYFELDGTFPNHEANPLKLETLADLSRKVVETGADLGVCFDGDADRAAFVDEHGTPVGSDLMTALIGCDLLAKNRGSHIVYDLRSSRAVAEAIREAGGVPVRDRVGHSFMKATLRHHQGVFGGELAGHYYFRDASYADSSLLAVIQVLNLLRKKQRSLSELVQPLRRYAKTPEINFRVEDKTGMIARLAERYADGEIDYLDGITVAYPEWWFNVRPSNTEPYLRLVLEADTEAMLEERRERLIAMLGEPV